MDMDYFVLDHGNNLYLAPEAANQQAYNEKVDIYSFGVILRLLLTGKAEPPPPPPLDEEGSVTGLSESIADNSRPASIRIEPDLATPMQLLIGETLISIRYSHTHTHIYT
jgi:serine/threonine protein kinase